MQISITINLFRLEVTMKRYIPCHTKPDFLNQTITELKSYSSHPSIKYFAEGVIEGINEDPDRYTEDRLSIELSIAEICYQASEAICDITGIYPYVSPMYTFLLPDLQKYKYMNDWVYSFRYESGDPVDVQTIVSTWISKYTRVLKDWYKSQSSRDPKLKLPSAYADCVLSKDKHIFLTYCTVYDREVAKSFIKNTVEPIYQRSK